MEHIRNFVIIAHVDHGKSTLADRFLELTGTVERRKMRDQYLDMHPLERERGITIKMQPVRMLYQHRTQVEYVFNLIDTPGHVDFSYEVSRALAAVEGAILLVDATQGIQAQTLAHFEVARAQGLAIIPAVNKIDLPSAAVEETREALAQLLGVDRKTVLQISGKEGTGVEALLAEVVEKVPPPQNADRTRELSVLRALIFDSKYDSYQGVIAYVRIVEGEIRAGAPLLFMAAGAKSEALEVGVFLPERTAAPVLGPGEIGYIATGIKEPEKVRVGDTVISVDSRGLYRDQHGSFLRNPAYSQRESAVAPLEGYKEPEPMVFASIFPENQDDYEALRDALKKLKLEDSALTFAPEESVALGRGMRAGFLGMLHMEIVAERLRRDYGLHLVFSTPSVAFKIILRTVPPQEIMVYAAAKLPPDQEIAAWQEPWVSLEIITPSHFVGALATILHEHEGKMVATENLGHERLVVRAEAPLREVVVDFYDALKSVSQGFASLSYAPAGYRPADLVRLDILIAGERMSPFSEILPRATVYQYARNRLVKLKELLPHQLFAVALQGEVEGTIIARETIPALKKDVAGYLYGGDRTRKMKLWKKQQRGKERLKAAARVTIPPEVFLKMVRRDNRSH